jgi:broad specificity phosphatase PhoE
MLLLVRHGRTDANAQGLLLGRLDPSLSEEGRAQAAALAAKIPQDARVIASPLSRTRQTAEAFGLPFEVDERWIELDYGELDGLPLRDVPPDLWREWRADPAFAPPGGESIAALGVRVRAACTELVDEIREHDVVVVSHVSPIKAAIAWALGAGDDLSWRLFVQVASVARIGADQWGTTLRSFNEL